MQQRCPLLAEPVQLTNTTDADGLIWLLQLSREQTAYVVNSGRLLDRELSELVLQVRFGDSAQGDIEQSLETLFYAQVGVIGG